MAGLNIAGPAKRLTPEEEEKRAAQLALDRSLTNQSLATASEAGQQAARQFAAGNIAGGIGATGKTAASVASVPLAVGVDAARAVVDRAGQLKDNVKGFANDVAGTADNAWQQVKAGATGEDLTKPTAVDGPTAQEKDTYRTVMGMTRPAAPGMPGVANIAAPSATSVAVKQDPSTPERQPGDQASINKAEGRPYIDGAGKIQNQRALSIAEPAAPARLGDTNFGTAGDKPQETLAQYEARKATEAQRANIANIAGMVDNTTGGSLGEQVMRGVRNRRLLAQAQGLSDIAAKEAGAETSRGQLEVSRTNSNTSIADLGFRKDQAGVANVRADKQLEANNRQLDISARREDRATDADARREAREAMFDPLKAANLEAQTAASRAMAEERLRDQKAGRPITRSELLATNKQFSEFAQMNPDHPAAKSQAAFVNYISGQEAGQSIAGAPKTTPVGGQKLAIRPEILQAAAKDPKEAERVRRAIVSKGGNPADYGL